MTTSTNSMKKYTTTEYGKQNMFASEPPMQYVEDYQGYGPHAVQLNGRLAMIGFFALIHNIDTTIIILYTYLLILSTAVRDFSRMSPLKGTYPNTDAFS